MARAQTEEAFCEAAELAVRHCLQSLEHRRKLLAKAGEVEFSTDLADLLSQGGVPTTAEPHVNGHVDLVITHVVAGRLRMLGECKLDRGPKYHRDGTTQVLLIAPRQCQSPYHPLEDPSPLTPPRRISTPGADPRSAGGTRCLAERRPRPG